MLKCMRWAALWAWLSDSPLAKIWTVYSRDISVTQWNNIHRTFAG